MADLPLILLTNDDGVDSPGLWAAAEAVLELGELFIAAPQGQMSAASRSLGGTTIRMRQEKRRVGEAQVPVLSVESTPAQAVLQGVLELGKRKPDLTIAGINYGANLGSGITVSGTIGAAIEAASFGIPSMAVSLDTEERYHFYAAAGIDFSVAAWFTRLFAKMVLSRGMPPGVDILKVEIPRRATEETGWRWTRVSRRRYYHAASDGQTLTYGVRVDLEGLERDSDIYAMAVDKVVSVSPLTIDLTAKVELESLERGWGET